MDRITNWRELELSYDEVVKKYPDVPPLWILKVDAQRRGIVYTDAAKALVNPELHQVNGGNIALFRTTQDFFPESLTLPDGSFLITNFDLNNKNPQRDPYIVDVINNKPYIMDGDKVLTEVGYWEKPDFYNEKASNGEPLYKYVAARPQRLDITLHNYCHFWDQPGEGCKYCPMSPNFKRLGMKEERFDTKYIVEAIQEALKQKGRFSSILITGGSVLTGEHLFDDELNEYIELLQEIGKCFNTKKFPSQLIPSAFDERQLQRLYEETGLMTYTADIEVLDKEKFEWICPGKAKHVGYDEWKRRLIASVDYFGRGNVSTGVVLGTELATPNGFTSEEEAFNRVTEQADEIISHGISIAANVWRTTPGAIFQNQNTPSLDYYVKTYRRFDQLHHKYEVNPYMDDYRRCGAHPGLDLLRI